MSAAQQKARTTHLRNLELVQRVEYALQVVVEAVLLQHRVVGTHLAEYLTALGIEVLLGRTEIGGQR
jgi:hypothetical protein